MTKFPHGLCPLGCGMDVALIQGQAHFGHQCHQSLNYAPQDYPYGMRDFNVRTPDGHLLIFSQPLTEYG